jgi:predicted RNA-binding Zn-ribbon protein involved in translation (DUF1610 family)
MRRFTAGFAAPVPLVDLAVFNEAIAQQYHSIMYAGEKLKHYNGIACPTCGKELVDSCPDAYLMSSPLRKNIHCPEDGCGYTGLRNALQEIRYEPR